METRQNVSSAGLMDLVEQLQDRLARLEAKLAALQAELAALRAEVARLRKDSSNSSKPPSSDIVKSPKPSPSFGRKKRRIGGQPGHPRHERPAFSPDQIDRTRD
jgi:transposase